MQKSLSPSRFRSLIVWLVASLILIVGIAIIYSLSAPRSGIREITFKHAKPQRSPFAISKLAPPGWITTTYQTLQTFKAKLSKPSPNLRTPPDLKKSVDLGYQKLLLRYPQLAVPMRTVPDAENGFLQLLNCIDRMELASPSPPSFPFEITNYLKGKGPWDGVAAAKWLTDNQAQVAEVRAIGLLPGRSAKGIPMLRWVFIPSKYCLIFNKMLILEARLAAERGDGAAALEAVRAAQGLWQHLSEIETPTLLFYIYKTLLRQNLATAVVDQILPALPLGQVDLAAWENILKPTATGSADLARFFKGEWHSGICCFILPIILNSHVPDTLTDGGEFLDFYSLRCIEVCHTLETTPVRDLDTLQLPPIRDLRHLSEASRKMVTLMDSGATSTKKSLIRTESIIAMTQAAFTIMNDQPIPKDPIFGQDYEWDPATRQLTFPPHVPLDSPIPPITVPKLRSKAANKP